MIIKLTDKITSSHGQILLGCRESLAQNFLWVSLINLVSVSNDAHIKSIQFFKNISTYVVA